MPRRSLFYPFVDRAARSYWALLGCFTWIMLYLFWWLPAYSLDLAWPLDLALWLQLHPVSGAWCFCRCFHILPCLKRNSKFTARAGPLRRFAKKVAYVLNCHWFEKSQRKIAPRYVGVRLFDYHRCSTAVVLIPGVCVFLQNEKGFVISYPILFRGWLFWSALLSQKCSLHSSI